MAAFLVVAFPTEQPVTGEQHEKHPHLRWITLSVAGLLVLGGGVKVMKAGM